jgi:uncharacterized protein
MLFHVSGSATFLGDSIHALPEGNASIPTAIWEIQKHATHVVFETDFDRPPSLPDLAVLDEKSPLSSLVSPATFEATLHLWKKFGIQLTLETLKPWFAGIVLANSLADRLGFYSRLGADRQVWQATSPERRFVLEGLEALTAFDDAPRQEQAAYLAMIAQTPEVVTGRLQRLFSYWQSNNTHGFEQELLVAKQQFPKMFSGLVDERNANWLPHITKLIEHQIPSLILVGAFHLVGESGLPTLIRRQGHEVSVL